MKATVKATDVEHCERTGRMVGHCGCALYVARILGLMGGAGELVTPTLEVRLVA